MVEKLIVCELLMIELTGGEPCIYTRSSTIKLTFVSIVVELFNAFTAIMQPLLAFDSTS